MIEDIQQRPELTAVEIVRDVEARLESILTKFPVTELIVVNGGQFASQNRHEWFDDQVTERSTALTADITAHAALATGIAVVVADTSIFKVGDQIFVDLFRPVYQITTITNGTDLVVKEIANEALANTSGNGSSVTFTRGALEISSFDTFEGARVGTQYYNFTQIFREDVRVSEDLWETARLKGIYAMDDLWNNAKEQAMIRLAFKMYRSITIGVGVERTTTGTLGMMGGVRQFIDKSGGNVVQASGALTRTMLDDAARLIFEDTGSLDNIAIIVPTALSESIGAFDANIRRYNDPSVNGRTGTNVASYIPSIGGMPALPIYIDQNMPRNEIWFLDRRRLQLIPFGSHTMQFFDEKIPGVTAKTGYFRGTYTLVVRNGLTNHAIIKGITV